MRARAENAPVTAASITVAVVSPLASPAAGIAGSPAAVTLLPEASSLDAAAPSPRRAPLEGVSLCVSLALDDSRPIS